jgi:glycosyltransferase involved in cell wall biosynthesis
MKPVVVLFAHYGEEWIRGSERCLLDLLAHLDRRRFAPVAWCNARTMEAELAALDVTVHRSRFTIMADWGRPKWDVANWLRLVREGKALAARYGVQLLHSNSGAPVQWLVPVASSRRVPLLAHLHSPYPLRSRCTLGLHQVSLAVGVSQACIDGLLEDGVSPERVRVIPNGVDAARLEAQVEAGFRTRLGYGPEHFVIAQIGSLIRRKGVDVLLGAFRQLYQSHPGARLILAGDGPDRAQLEALRDQLGLGDEVRFLGDFPQPGKLLHDVADVVVSASRHEPFGLTLIEAGAFARPVVATDTAGARDILRDGANGLVVPPEDTGALAAALARLLDDPALRTRLGAALRATVQERFTVERYTDAFAEAYSGLLERGGLVPGRREMAMSLRVCTRWLGGVLRARGAARVRSPALRSSP